MKIIFVSGLYPPTTKGGGEISTHLIARGLIERGHDVRVIAQGNVREEVEFEGVPVLRVPIALTAKPLFEKWHFKKVARMLEREIARIIESNTSPSPSPANTADKPSKGEGNQWVVHAHDYKSALALSEMSGGRKWRAVVTVRDYAQISGDTNNILFDGCIPDKAQTWGDAWRSQRVKEVSGWRKVMRWLQYVININYRRQALASISNQIFLSKAEREVIARVSASSTPGDDSATPGVFPALTSVKHEVIFNPVAPDYLATSMNGGVKGNVLYIGRVEMYKGVGLLLAAWREVADKFPQAKLKIVGEGAQRKEYEKLIELWGLQYRVLFVGKIAWDRLITVYDEAQIVVAPHLWIEPFGRTVAEAMARGKVVVAANVGGSAEMINDDRGLLFARGSVNELSTKLGQALNMNDYDRSRMQRASRKWTEVNLNQDVIASQYEDFYSNLAK